ncbi:MAG: Uma2 family endonuclease [Rubrivivax sp.]|nr:Uma2 family endonuclease [Pyrinomonadaceae bacterium]
MQPGSPTLAVVDLSSIVELTDERLYELCQANRELRLERTAEGELVIMSPTGGETSRRNAQLIAQLVLWANQDRTGISFDSSGGFRLPNGAIRSPDAAWVRLVPWLKLTDEQKEKFIPLCPDFVVELRSATDSLQDLQDKMQEYLDNSVQLGWLIDPQEKRIHVYRSQTQVEILDSPESIAGDPVLKGFVLDLQEIW